MGKMPPTGTSGEGLKVGISHAAGLVNPLLRLRPRAHALGKQLLADKCIGSDVHWGNEGFCIDAALHHGGRGDDVTLGVLCDFSRFPHSADPIEWDIFRGAILRSQGWQLHQVWTPHFVRDPAGALNRIAAEAQHMMAEEAPGGTP